jgi:uncharacterized membrane protein
MAHSSYRLALLSLSAHIDIPGGVVYVRRFFEAYQDWLSWLYHVCIIVYQDTNIINVLNSISDDEQFGMIFDNQSTT